MVHSRLVAGVATAAAVVAIVAVALTRAGGPDTPRVPRLPGPAPSPTAAPSPTMPVYVDVNGGDVFPSVDRFLEAAAAGNARAMWEEMSRPARASFGDDVAKFQEFFAGGVSEGLGSGSRKASDASATASSRMSTSRARCCRCRLASTPPPFHLTIEWPLADGPFEAEFKVPRDVTPADAAVLDSRRPESEVLLREGPQDIYMVTAPVPDEPVYTEVGIPELEEAGARAVWAPRGLFSGEFFLTVVVLGNDGVLRADATRYVVP